MAGYIGSKASVVTPGAERKKVFSITTTTTSLTGLVYTPGFVHVYHNGVRLVDGTDYTATNGTSITLTTAAQSGDEVVVISFATFQTSDTVSASAGGTFSNAVTIDANGATVLTVDRATSDGTIIDLQKNGSSVGSVGAFASTLRLSSGDTGVLLNNAAQKEIVPTEADGSEADGTIRLGNSGRRFQDLYLSGGVYLGGTGAANYLDDYEEGTWTPSISYTTSGTLSVGYSVQVGNYVKIGSTVFFRAELRLSSFSKGTASGSLLISNLPFTSKAHTYGADQLCTVNTYFSPLPTTAGHFPSGQTLGGTTNFRLQVIRDNNTFGEFPDPDNDSQYKISGYYQTDA